MKLTFCGAAKIVTGSCYLIETERGRFLVDCGMFQGTKDITRLNYEPFRFNPEELSCVFLTHAHIDHSGLIPKLAAEGFKGKIYATSATIDLCRIMLEDSAEVQMMDHEDENKRRAAEGLEPRKPIYTMEDVLACMPQFEAVEYGRLYSINRSLQVRYLDAGHIIGSAIIELFISERGETKKIVFSGDLGQMDAPIVSNPSTVEDADYLVMESTYGDRLHDDIRTRDETLLSIVQEAYERRGKLMIPSFAVERTQELLYSFRKLYRAGRMPHEKVFLDSPLAVKATEIFENHRECFDKEAAKDSDPFNFPSLVCLNSRAESKELNNYPEPCIIIAGNGMATGGRIRHHFRHGLPEPCNTVLFVGFQAEGTLGRIILEGARTVRMMGLDVEVNAQIRVMNSYSAHADYEGLLRWANGFVNKPRTVFVCHGEECSSRALSLRLKERNFRTYVPSIGETVEI